MAQVVSGIGSGQTYTTVKAWADDIISNTGIVTYSAGDEAIGEIHGVVVETVGGLDLDVPVFPPGATKITLRPANTPGNKHTGITGTQAGTTYAKIQLTAAFPAYQAIRVGFTNNADSLVELNIEDLEIENSGTTTNSTILDFQYANGHLNPLTINIRRNLLYTNVSSGGSTMVINNSLVISNYEMNIYNNIIWMENFGAPGAIMPIYGIFDVYMSFGGGYGANILNNTIAFCGDYGIWQEDVAPPFPGREGDVKNNICVGHSVDDFSIPFAISSNNLSEKPAATGKGDRTIPLGTVAAQFVLYGSPTGSNLLLASGSVAINDGVDLGTIPQNIETDITGYSRPTAPPVWDIGANEFVSVGPNQITRNITDGLIFAETYTRIGGSTTYVLNITDGIQISESFSKTRTSTITIGHPTCPALPSYDYALVSVWGANVLYGTLWGPDDIIIAEIYGLIVETVNVFFGGNVKGIIIRPGPGQKHSGEPTSPPNAASSVSAKILIDSVVPIGLSAVFTAQNPLCIITIEDMEIERAGENHCNAVAMGHAGGINTLRRCIIYSTTNVFNFATIVPIVDARVASPNNGGNQTNIHSNIIWKESGIVTPPCGIENIIDYDAVWPHESGANITNNTVLYCDKGISQVDKNSYGTIPHIGYIMNNISMDNVTADFEFGAGTTGGVSGGALNNMSSDNTSQGLYTGYTPASQFVDPATPSPILFLKPGAVAINKAVNLYLSYMTGTEEIEKDILSNDRSLVSSPGLGWDLGSHEFGAGTGGATIPNQSDGLTLGESFSLMGLPIRETGSEGILLSDSVEVTKERIIKKVYYSVGISTADFKPAGVTVTITPYDYTATFSLPITGNVGVGDVVEYGGNFAYINEKVSTSIWKVVAGNGDMPAAAAATSVASIKRTFPTLPDAVHGASPGAAQLLGTDNLVAKGVSVLIPCYDDGDDEVNSYIQIYGWASGGIAGRTRVMIYTPTNTTTECNFSQRHNGTASGGGYTLVPGVPSTASTVAQQSALGGIHIYSSSVDIIGLRIMPDIVGYNPTGYAYQGGVICAETTACVIANNYFQAREDLPVNHYIWQHLWNLATTTSKGNNWFINNIVYQDGMYDGTNGRVFSGIAFWDYYANNHIANEPGGMFNNTVFGDFIDSGISCKVYPNGTSSTFDPLYVPLIVNNVVKGTESPSYTAQWKGDYAFNGVLSNAAGTTSNLSGGFIYNVSHDATAGTSNGNQGIIAEFWGLISLAPGAENFHIKTTSSLIGIGIGPADNGWLGGTFFQESVLPDWSHRYDIDLQERRGMNSDVGCDQVRQSFYETLPLRETFTRATAPAAHRRRGDKVLISDFLIKNIDNTYDDINYVGVINDLLVFSATIEEI
jgi:hypothetical protein